MIVYCDSENCIYNNGKGICEAGKVEIVGRECTTFVRDCLTYVKKESEVNQNETASAD